MTVLAPGVKLTMAAAAPRIRTAAGTSNPPKPMPSMAPIGTNHRAITAMANRILGLPNVGVIPNIITQAAPRSTIRASVMLNIYIPPSFGR
jgi:hypothetical protein